MRLPSRSGGRKRQIDVLIRLPLADMGEELMVVDCKRYGSKVDVKDVEAFVGLVEDVGAAMGLLVTTDSPSASPTTSPKTSSYLQRESRPVGKLVTIAPAGGAGQASIPGEAEALGFVYGAFDEIRKAARGQPKLHVFLKLPERHRAARPSLEPCSNDAALRRREQPPKAISRRSCGDNEPAGAREPHWFSWRLRSAAQTAAAGSRPIPLI
ncbi:MAG: restriction endonuclease, partial [Actinobacteria bacterium]|nr:restriction endonuclease [Actinomycetota bacterium]